MPTKILQHFTRIKVFKHNQNQHKQGRENRRGDDFHPDFSTVQYLTYSVTISNRVIQIFYFIYHIISLIFVRHFGALIIYYYINGIVLSQY